ncbi:MAG: hypothetical protein H7836_11450 [Magnetococcus sp. YQC-3]
MFPRDEVTDSGESHWFEPIIELLSFPNKAFDADEIGVGWLGALLDTVIRPLAAKVPVVMIGHSFGARAGITAACHGSILQRSNQSPASEKNPVSLYIGLQPAFGVQRIFSQDRMGVGFPDQCHAGASRIVMTSSKWDEAVTKVSFDTYVGSGETWEEVCSSGKIPYGVQCQSAAHDGFVELKDDGIGHIFYVNADQLIHTNAYQTGGGAHSDIYRKETGNFLWNVIRATPAPGLSIRK